MSGKQRNCDQCGQYHGERTNVAVFEFAEWLVKNGDVPADLLERYTLQVDALLACDEDADSIRRAQQMVLAALSRPALRLAAQQARRSLARNYDTVFVAIGRRDGFACAHCGSSGRDLQIDHVTPLIRGGTNDLDNLQLLCAQCNARKSDRL